MPKWLICVPLVAQWLWLSLRYRSATLPSAANPAITAGGLVGETKMEYFRSMGSHALAATAPHVVLPSGARNPAQALALLDAAGLQFPLMLKPDLGMCGFGVRRVDHAAALVDYLSVFPPDQDVVAQAWLREEGEAGIFTRANPVPKAAESSAWRCVIFRASPATACAPSRS